VTKDPTNAISSSSKENLLRTMQRPNSKPSDLMQRILPEDLFLGMLCLERKRAERSGRKSFLLLINFQDAVETARRARVLQGIVKVASTTRRETDPAGWYKNEEILGIIFTEFGTLCGSSVIDSLVRKLRQALAAELSAEDLVLVHVSGHIFPPDSDDKDSNATVDLAFYPDLLHRLDAKKLPLLLKRVMDILGAATALVLLSPLLVAIALMVKLTSKGPVIFRQQRVGQFGVTFEFLKFRSMCVANDVSIHEEYVRSFIAGRTQSAIGEANAKAVYKLVGDPRVTGIGRFMRRTSLDELPQFWNVLKGEMSLVGPRPSVPYETKGYGVWHWRRLVEAKPGITGLWQVHGRSRTTFDEMVRLDLRYSTTWSTLLDVKILLQTPGAVLSGDGAY
jgi:lipopolysaccharide/colanic/teichoic acid biosynthesis glycosyltransferase